MLFRLTLGLNEMKAGSQFVICIFGSFTHEFQSVLWAELSRGDRLKTESQFVIHFMMSFQTCEKFSDGGCASEFMDLTVSGTAEEQTAHIKHRI